MGGLMKWSAMQGDGQGSQGPQGPKGDKGDPGDQGPQGEQGEGYSPQEDIEDASTSSDVGVVFDPTQIESELNSQAAKINEVIQALRDSGILQ